MCGRSPFKSAPIAVIDQMAIAVVSYLVILIERGARRAYTKSTQCGIQGAPSATSQLGGHGRKIAGVPNLNFNGD